MENKTINRAKMSDKQCIKARLQYLQYSAVIKVVKRHHEPPVLLILTVFLTDLLDSPFKFFV